MARVIILVVTAAALTTFLAYQFPNAAIGPGELSTEHFKSSNSCLDCHALFQGASSNKCIDCHDPQKIGIYTVDGKPVISNGKPIGFHKDLTKASCISCHSEHQGRSAIKAQFSHKSLPSNYLDKCINCHDKPSTIIHDNITPDCSHCHSTERWLPANFDHRAYFRFDKDHDGKCSTCHLDNIYSEYTCYTCHEHSEKKVERKHAEEGIPNIKNCTECHRSGDEDDAERIWKTKKNRTAREKYERSHQESVRYKRKHYEDSDDDHHEKVEDDEDDD